MMNNKVEPFLQSPFLIQMTHFVIHHSLIGVRYSTKSFIIHHFLTAEAFSESGR
jgi:hypothetical protein